MILNMGFTHHEIVYILAFYALGAALGFFSFRYDRTKPKLESAFNCILTIFIGMFLAYIFASYLEEHKVFSTSMNMLVGGLGSFGLPDLVIKNWPKITDKIADLAMHKVAGKELKEIEKKKQGKDYDE